MSTMNVKIIDKIIICCTNRKALKQAGFKASNQLIEKEQVYE